MTKDSSFKRRVRERMDKTGESYAAARGQVAPSVACRGSAPTTW